MERRGAAETGRGRRVGSVEAVLARRAIGCARRGVGAGRARHLHRAVRTGDEAGLGGNAEGRVAQASRHRGLGDAVEELLRGQHRSDESASARLRIRFVLQIQPRRPLDLRRADRPPDGACLGGWRSPLAEKIMSETIQSIWGALSGFFDSRLGVFVAILGAYLLLQLVILPRLGIST